MNHSLMAKFRMLTANDFLSVFKFLIGVIVSPFFISKRKNVWLICEDKNEARDNGYWLFKYLCEKRQDIECVYAINYESVDFQKVECLGKTCKYGSVNHWIYYICSKYNISSQKGGKPNAAVCYILEVYGIVKSKSIFLQHGITLNNGQWLHYENTKMRLFICGAEEEYKFIKKEFGYPNNNVQLLGFSRFDELYNINVEKNTILIMPTWREWLNSKTDAYYELGYDGIFQHSTYYKKWNELLNSDEFDEFLEKNNLNVIFFPHRNSQKYLNMFQKKSDRITFASWEKYDVQDLLKKSALLITDYSSVAIDFAYMNKPVIYFTFDIDDFRAGQYEKGYFDYENNQLGFSVTDVSSLILLCQKLNNDNFNLDINHINSINDFFGIRDNKNNERIVHAIEEL